jgi:phospholipid/cholesterol/gamma-HCH transport system ATP-binding protein
MAVFIEFIDVYKSFGERQILDGVSFQVEQGESFAILGPSGIGKTVTLTHIVGLLKPDSGRIIVDGEDITDMNERQLAPVRKKVQLVFQSGALFDSMTVAENVAFPLNDIGLSSGEIDRRVQEKLHLVEIEDIANLLPSDRAPNQAKLAIARGPGRGAPGHFYDEPTTWSIRFPDHQQLIRKMQSSFADPRWYARYRQLRGESCRSWAFSKGQPFCRNFRNFMPARFP